MENGKSSKEWWGQDKRDQDSLVLIPGNSTVHNGRHETKTKYNDCTLHIPYHKCQPQSASSRCMNLQSPYHTPGPYNYRCLRHTADPQLTDTRRCDSTGQLYGFVRRIISGFDVKWAWYNASLEFQWYRPSHSTICRLA